MFEVGQVFEVVNSKSELECYTVKSIERYDGVEKGTVGKAVLSVSVDGEEFGEVKRRIQRFRSSSSRMPDRECVIVKSYTGWSFYHFYSDRRTLNGRITEDQKAAINYKAGKFKRGPGRFFCQFEYNTRLKGVQVTVVPVEITREKKPKDFESLKKWTQCSGFMKVGITTVATGETEFAMVEIHTDWLGNEWTSLSDDYSGKIAAYQIPVKLHKTLDQLTSDTSEGDKKVLLSKAGFECRQVV